MSAKLNSEKIITNINSELKDIQDLQQECLGYMKTKKFLAQRICQQQEKIIFLKYVTSSHCEEHEQMYNIMNNLQKELYSIKALLNQSEDDNEGDDEDFDSQHTTNYQAELNQIEEENNRLKMEIERRKLDLLSNASEVNLIKNQKEILLNEIKEVLTSCEGVDIDKFHQFFKKNLSKEILPQVSMPLSKGIKYNLLSALSQASYVIESDLVDRRIKNDWEKSNGVKIRADYCRDDKMKTIDAKFDKNFRLSGNTDKDVDRQTYFKAKENVGN